MTQNEDNFWQATQDNPGEAPEWVNRDYDEKDEQPKSRRWMIWVTVLLSAFLAFGGLWSTLEPLLK